MSFCTLQSSKQYGEAASADGDKLPTSAVTIKEEKVEEEEAPAADEEEGEEEEEEEEEVRSCSSGTDFMKLI